MKNRVYILSLLMLCLFSYQFLEARNRQSRINRVIEEVKSEYAPDKRVEIFEIRARKEKGRWLLEGITTDAEAKKALVERLQQQGSKFTDCIQVLPDTVADGKIYGIVNLSVINMRNQPDYGEEMATQALLGMPVRILQRKSWIRIQTPDRYIGWCSSGSVYAMDKAAYNDWLSAPKVVFTAHYGFSYAEPDLSAQTVSDLVSGNMLKLEKEAGEFYQVSYPDGRNAYVLRKQSQPYNEWLDSRKYTAESLIVTGKTLLGVPYLWGGTSAKGVDCSGFIKTLTFLNGLILKRDASQQAYTGTNIDVSKGFELLKPGDLLFFGKKAENGNKEKVIHVALYMGNLEFIHSQTRVRISSFDPESPYYDEYNLNRFIRASRILDAIGTEGISTVRDHLFYQPQ